MTGYGRREPSGWEMAFQGMNFLGNAMRTGQQIGEQRYQSDERDGLNKAYEYISGKLGSQGDISALDGDPILNTRQGTMAMGQFMQQRAGTETSRLQMLKAMDASNDHLYQNFFRPVAFAAQEAFKAGDMQRFGSIASELSAKSPMPYRLVPGQDGNFDVEFRSDAAGGWTHTNRRLTPQEAMSEIDSILGGEQQILSGANMQTRVVNPRFLASSARYKMGTIMSNAEALADPKKWIPLTKNGHTVYAIPQNRHDDYSVGPSYRVLDEKGGTSAMAGSLDELMSQGYVRADVKASVENAQRIAAGRGTGKGGGTDAGGMPFKISDGDRSWINGLAATQDIDGNKSVNPVMGMALEMLMGVYGQSRYSALQAYQNGVGNIMESLRKENPEISQEQAKSFAEQHYCNYLRQQMQGGGKAAPVSAQRAPSPVTPDQSVQSRSTSKLSQSVKDAANGTKKAQPEPESLTPEEQHQRLVDSGAGALRGLPETLNNGWNWYWDSMKNNAE